MSTPTLEHVLEVVLLAAGRALKLDELLEVLADSPIEADRAAVRAALSDLQTHWEARGLELIQVASGYRLQVRVDYAPWIARLWAERPARYSRALLETLALIAYRQPITRGEIEDVRGVSVSSSIIKTLLERDWVRVLGHRDVPGRPAIYGTTRNFLDDFSLKGLEDLPPLAEVRDIDRFHDDMFAEQVSEARENAPRGDELIVGDGDEAGAGPDEIASEDIASEDTGPENITPQDAAAEDLVSEDVVAPEEPATEKTTLQDAPSGGDLESERLEPQAEVTSATEAVVSAEQLAAEQDEQAR